jgi:hypothetical protein
MQNVSTHVVLLASSVAGTTVPDAEVVSGAPAEEACADVDAGAEDSVTDSGADDSVGALELGSDEALDDSALEDPALEVTEDVDAADPADEDATVELDDDSTVGVPDSPELQPATASAAAVITVSTLARTVLFIFVVPFDMMARASTWCPARTPRQAITPGPDQR